MADSKWVSSRKSTLRAKLKAMKEKPQKWKEHFKNLLETSEITYKPTEEIIND